MKSPYNGFDLMFFVRRFLLLHDDSVISRKEIRELSLLLLLSECGLMTKDQIKLIIIYTDDTLRNYSNNTLSSIVSRLCKLESLKEIEKENRIFITVSKSGPTRMIELLDKLFSYLNLNLNDYTSKDYLLERATRTINSYSIKPHSIFINTSIIFSIFAPKFQDNNFYIRKEKKISSPFSNRNLYGKSEDDIYPDILYIPSRVVNSACAIEVDLGTEDISSNKSGSILPKIAAYTRIYDWL